MKEAIANLEAAFTATMEAAESDQDLAAARIVLAKLLGQIVGAESKGRHATLPQLLENASRQMQSEARAVSMKLGGGKFWAGNDHVETTIFRELPDVR